MLLRLLPTFALIASVPVAAQSAPGGDPVKGSRQFLQCKACHNVAEKGPHAVGPNLWGVAGAKAGSKPGFNYSQALTKAGITWTPEQLDTFLARPNGKVPGTKMVFAGIANPQARKDVIAYLATLKKR
ncbi:c-type cytochrome [Novosphingobium ginsenosidimutans]|uniref:Cytochrome c family protein n=1 Tax=Novosphingobium ginsenosidimutans TaxID=1176536 RepID=A0A5B8S6L0_9SPHN|nr:cytochrome c family protein [Novosphingobium ginsenosidimutans]QEA16612.1 cytochrome c family protein [Novosphingobium ginsenosidimutans]